MHNYSYYTDSDEYADQYNTHDGYFLVIFNFEREHQCVIVDGWFSNWVVLTTYHYFVLAWSLWNVACDGEVAL